MDGWTECSSTCKGGQRTEKYICSGNQDSDCAHLSAPEPDVESCNDDVVCGKMYFL